MPDLVSFRRQHQHLVRVCYSCATVQLVRITNQRLLLSAIAVLQQGNNIDVAAHCSVFASNAEQWHFSVIDEQLSDTLVWYEYLFYLKDTYFITHASHTTTKIIITTTTKNMYN
ncbi:hypothetical protein CVS40_10627 [Lucilia cuprina]|nr:hypothetical protein CVS40_10627 [Lucilia cuprina]